MSEHPVLGVDLQGMQSPYSKPRRQGEYVIQKKIPTSNEVNVDCQSNILMSQVVKKGICQTDPVVEVQKYLHTHTHIYIYIYIYMI